MKTFSTLVIGCFFSLILSSQPFINISTPISVTDNSTAYGRHLPKVDVLGDGTIVVFWSKPGSNSGLFLAKWLDDTFGDVIEIPTGSIQPDIWSGGLGPDFVIYENTIYVTFEKYNESIYCVRSLDGGISFEDPVVAFTPPSGRAATLPVITVDNEGNPIIGAITTNLSEQDAMYEIFRSVDGGITFEAPVIAHLAADGDEVCECCPSNITVADDDQIYVSFRNNNDNIRDIWISKSSDGGLTFPEASDVDETDWFIQGCPSTGPQSIEMGNSLLNVFFSAAEDWDSGVYLSTLNKTSFESEELLKLAHFEGTANLQNFPSISGKSDTIGVVWHESTGTVNNIGFVWSVDGVNGFSQPAVNISNADFQQRYPDILYHDGQFHIVYEDQETFTVLYQTIDFQPLTSVSQNENPESFFKIWPNPARKDVNISLLSSTSGLFSVEILDLRGQSILKEINITGKRNIDLQQLEKGIYIVKVISGNKYWYKRLVIR